MFLSCVNNNFPFLHVKFPNPCCRLVGQHDKVFTYKLLQFQIDHNSIWFLSPRSCESSIILRYIALCALASFPNYLQLIWAHLRRVWRLLSYSYATESLLRAGHFGKSTQPLGSSCLWRISLESLSLWEVLQSSPLTSSTFPSLAFARRRHHNTKQSLWKLWKEVTFGKHFFPGPTK